MKKDKGKVTNPSLFTILEVFSNYFSAKFDVRKLHVLNKKTGMCQVCTVCQKSGFCPKIRFLTTPLWSTNLKICAKIRVFISILDTKVSQMFEFLAKNLILIFTKSFTLKILTRKIQFFDVFSR